MAIPTVTDKVILIDFTLPETNVFLLNEYETNQQFSTLDVGSAFIGFKAPIATDLDGMTAKISLVNLDDDSFVNHTESIVSLTNHDETENTYFYQVRRAELERIGKWIGIVSFVDINGKTWGTRKFTFLIEGDILDVKTTKLHAIDSVEDFMEDMSALMLDFNGFIAQMETNETTRGTTFTTTMTDFTDLFNQAQQLRTDAFNQAQSGRTGDFNASEASRGNTFTQNENARIGTFTQNETNRQAEFDLGESTRNDGFDADHLRAGNDHTQAVSDSSRAGTDHTTATADHTTALADHAVTADMIMNATNLVTNGDFSNGSAPWVLAGTSKTTLYTLDSKVGTNSIRMNTTNSSSIVAFDVEVPVGNIVYVGVWGKLLGFTDGMYVDSILTAHDSNAYTNVVEGELDKGLLNIWQHVSLIKKATTSSIKVLGGHVGYTIRDLLIDGFTVIDLTATFGKGNEPTVEQMDEIMSKFPNSWFDGTKNLFRASETLKKQIALDARTEFEAKNLVANGDFSNGTISGWNGSASGVYDDGRMKFNPDGLYDFMEFPIETISGNKYYFSGYMQATTSSVGFEMFGVRSTHPGDGTNKRMSFISSDYVGANKVIYANEFANSGWQPFWIDNILVIDLTKTFGAGKEPTLAEMDRLMARYPNSWFDGTKPIQTIETLYQEKANKVQEAWITPTLLNGFTGDVRYRKTETGMLQIVGNLKSPTALASEVLDIFTLPIPYIPVRFSNSGSGKFEIIEDAFYTFRTAKVVISQHTKTVIMYAGQNSTSWHFNIVTPLD